MTVLGLLTTTYGAPSAREDLESLLLGVAAKDSHSLEELYHRTRTAVYGLVLSYLKHPQDAEDVTQDAFVRIWDTAASYRPQGKPMAWLLTVARNLALMRLRERGKTQELTDELYQQAKVESVEYGETIDVAAVCTPKVIGQLGPLVEGWRPRREPWED